MALRREEHLAEGTRASGRVQRARLCPRGRHAIGGVSCVAARRPGSVVCVFPNRPISVLLFHRWPRYSMPKTNCGKSWSGAGAACNVVPCARVSPLRQESYNHRHSLSLSVPPTRRRLQCFPPAQFVMPSRGGGPDILPGSGVMPAYQLRFGGDGFYAALRDFYISTVEACSLVAGMVCGGGG